MKIINIEKVESSLQKTFLYYLNHIYECEYWIDEECVQQFIEYYLEEAKRYIEIPKAGELRKNRHIKFVDKKILDYEKKVEEILKSHRGGEQEERTYNFLKEGANSKIYNFCSLIIDCDNLLLHFDEYIDSIDLHYYKEAQEVLTHIQEKTIMVVSGITSFMIDMYADNILNLSQNYMIMPDAIHYLKAHKSIMAILKTVHEEEITCREFLEQERTHLFPVLCICCETMLLRKKWMY